MFLSKIISIFLLAFASNVSASAVDRLPVQQATEPTASRLAMAARPENRAYFDLSRTTLLPVPFKHSDSQGIKITADTAILIDRYSGKVLFEKDPDKKISIASITKIMTGLVAYDYWRSKLSQDITVTADQAFIEGSKIDLAPGERVSAGNLMESLLVASANDAAEALAANSGGPREDFVAKMNAKAKALGMNNSQFKNPSGLDEKGHYSTARDVAIMMAEAIKHEELLLAMQKAHVEFWGEDGQVLHRKTNTNRILDSFVNIKAGKTGFTDEAGNSFVAMAEGDEGQQLIAAVFNDDNRFQDIKALLDWGFRCFVW